MMGTAYFFPLGLSFAPNGLACLPLKFWSPAIVDSYLGAWVEEAPAVGPELALACPVLVELHAASGSAFAFFAFAGFGASSISSGSRGIGASDPHTVIVAATNSSALMT
jgi:hypothetical protein